MNPALILTEEVVRKAILGVAIVNNRELFVRYDGRLPQECVDAANLILTNIEQFQRLVWKRLQNMPLTKKYFGKMIRTRLKQNSILASPIISVIFDDYQALEQRLTNIKSITGIDSFRSEYRGSKGILLGGSTDATMHDMLAEILALDSLIQLGFVNIQKISRKDKAHIDILAEKDGQFYAIDVTRRQEVTDWKIEPETNLEDCDSKENQLEIRRVIMQELVNKDEQFCRALDAGTILKSSVKVVAIKTSDYGFSECIEQASRITEELLSEKNRYQHLDSVWLLPSVDVKQSKWVFKKGIAKEARNRR